MRSDRDWVRLVPARNAVQLGAAVFNEIGGAAHDNDQQWSKGLKHEKSGSCPSSQSRTTSPDRTRVDWLLDTRVWFTRQSPDPRLVNVHPCSL